MIFLSFIIYNGRRWLLDRIAERDRTRAEHLAWRAASWISALLMLSLMVSPLLLIAGVIFGPVIAVLALCILLGMALASASLPVIAMLAWRRGYWTPARRVLASLAGATPFAMIPFLHYWNLLGFRL